jgi:hypothetical protein
MPEPNIGQEAASVWESVIPPKGPTDNIFNSRALFFSLAGGGIKGLKSGEGFAGKESSAGGRVFEFSLEYATNTNFHSYGQFASLDLAWIPVFDAARYDIKTAAGTVNWTDLEIAKCQDSSAKFEIIEEKLENGKDSHCDDMNKQLLGVATASTDNITGIQTIISATPGGVGDIVGGIDANLWTFWRNKQTAGTLSVSAFDNLRPAMRSIYNQCSRGGMVDYPTAVLFRRQEFEGFESTLIPTERFTVENKEKNGQGAFMNEVLKFKGAEVFYDEDLNVNNGYMYNPKYLKIVYLKNYWMKMSDRLEPVNNLTFTQKVRTHWSFCTNQRRRLGVVTAIT